MTEEEKEQARQDAIERLRQEEMAKMRKPSQSKPTTEKKTQTSVNKLLKQNTGTLKLASEETVQAAGRTFQDVSNLDAANKELIANLNALNTSEAVVSGNEN